MTTCRPIRLNAFDMACVGHIQHGMWTHPRDRSADYTSLDHWVNLARMLERGLFDGLFLADVPVARNIDWHSRPSWDETQAPLMEIDDLAVKVDALAP